MNNFTTIKGTFIFDPKDKIYKDHFPGNPVIPGSLIVHSFIESVKKNCSVKNINTAKNFRFKEFISPGKYLYKMEPVEQGFKCNIYSREKVIVTGILQYET